MPCDFAWGQGEGYFSKRRLLLAPPSSPPPPPAKAAAKVETQQKKITTEKASSDSIESTKRQQQQDNTTTPSSSRESAGAGEGGEGEMKNSSENRGKNTRAPTTTNNNNNNNNNDDSVTSPVSVGLFTNNDPLAPQGNNQQQHQQQTLKSTSIIITPVNSLALESGSLPSSAATAPIRSSHASSLARPRYSDNNTKNNASRNNTQQTSGSSMRRNNNNNGSNSNLRNSGSNNNLRNNNNNNGGRTTTTTSTPYYTPRRSPSPATSSFGQSTMSTSSSSSLQHQGVLWKRRDVFKNHWRPRWFVLHPREGVLTYYLLNNNTSVASVSSSSASATTTSRLGLASCRSSGGGAGRRTRMPAVTDSPQRWTPQEDDDDNDNGDVFATGRQEVVDSLSRGRATSWESQVSEHSVDYEVVPRGTIYVTGSTVENTAYLSSQNFFVFTIRSGRNGGSGSSGGKSWSLHLAARTAQARRLWVERLQRVAAGESSPRRVSSRRNNDVVSTAAARVAGGAAAVVPVDQPDDVAGNNNSEGDTATEQTLPVAVEGSTRDGGGEDEDSLNYFDSFQPEEEEGQDDENLEEETNDVDQPRINDGDRGASDDEGKEEICWKSLLSSEDDSPLYIGVPPEVVSRIRQLLETYLPKASQPPPPGVGDAYWRPLFARGDHAAFQGTDLGDPTASSTVLSVAFMDQTPRQVLNLLLDVGRRPKYENNLRTAQRLVQWNDHTIAYYSAFHPVWPLASREFVVAQHWQCVRRKEGEQQTAGNSNPDDDTSTDDEERAVVVISFSCPPALADKLKGEVNPRNVRGDLCVSLVLLRPVGDRQCHLTRLLCVDPKLPSAVSVGPLTQAMRTQQAKLAAVMSHYLTRQEPLPPSRLQGGPLDDAALMHDVVSHLPRPTPRSAPEHAGHLLQQNASAIHSTTSPSVESPVPESVDGDEDHISPEEEEDATQQDVCRIPPLEVQAALLLAPIVAYGLMQHIEFPSAFLGFLLAAYIVMQHLVSLHLGGPGEEMWKAGTVSASSISSRRSSADPLVEGVTFRFAVDLKGALRFIANKKEEREELGQGTAEVSVVHLVTCAVARALKTESTLQWRRVQWPWLLLDEWIDASSESVSVTVSETGSRWVTLSAVNEKSVQRLADELESIQQQKEADGAIQRVGQCMVVAAPQADQTDMHVNVTPVDPNVIITAVVEGVRLERHGDPARSWGAPSLTRPPPPRHILSLSLTLRGPQTTDFAACRRLAEEVQKLLQFPEMCDQ